MPGAIQRPFSTHPHGVEQAKDILHESSYRPKDFQSTPCDLGGIGDSIYVEQAIEEPLLIVHNATPDLGFLPAKARQHLALDLDVLLPAPVKLLHWILLAQGSRWPRLQLLITYGAVVGWTTYCALPEILAWRKTRSNIDLLNAVINLLFGLETVVNAFFCYEFCQHNRLQRLIAWATARQDDFAPLVSLLKVSWGGWTCYLLFAGHFIQSNVVNGLLLSLSYGLMFYLCLLWLWMNWVIHTAAQYWVHHRLDADSVLGVGGRDAAKELWEILKHMKEVSSIWAKNHAVRFIITTASATAMLMLTEYQMHGDCGDGGSGPAAATDQRCPSYFFMAWQLATAVLLYILVWLTAAVPGYITDMLFTSLHRKLYIMMLPEPDTDIETPPTRQPHPLTPLEAKATALMHRAHYLQGREGMHFACVPMSLARAITIGTVLGYTIAFATRISK
jgi:hypothetical protein